MAMTNDILVERIGLSLDFRTKIFFIPITVPGPGGAAAVGIKMVVYKEVLTYVFHHHHHLWLEEIKYRP